MIRPLDVVALLDEHPALGLHAGQVGAVVEVYGDGQCEVEFVDVVKGSTYATAPFAADRLLKLRHTADAA